MEIVVHGDPAPQGSKTPWGQEASQGLKPWREVVAWEGKIVMGSRPPMIGPLAVHMTFSLSRPKSHATLSDPPVFVTRTPDLDKLVRAVGDALTGIVWKDDSHISRIQAEKCYGYPGVAITVVPL